MAGLLCLLHAVNEALGLIEFGETPLQTLPFFADVLQVRIALIVPIPSLGDHIFFYHSNCAEPGIVGVMEVVRESYPDHTAFDPDSKYYDPKSDPSNPRWYMVDVRYVRHLRRNITLSELKAHAAGPLAQLALVRQGNRLSVMPVTAEQWDFILSLE